MSRACPNRHHRRLHLHHRHHPRRLHHRRRCSHRLLHHYHRSGLRQVAHRSEEVFPAGEIELAFYSRPSFYPLYARENQRGIRGR